MGDPCELLEWDSQHFGFPVARLTPLAPVAEEFRAAVAWCRTEGVRCLYFLCDADAIESVRLAQVGGFDMIDVRITLLRRLDLDPVAPAAGGPLVVREATAADLGAVRAMTPGLFQGSRFYKDGRFPRGRVDALYQRWAERDFRTPGRLLVVSERDGRVVGFSSASCEGAGEGRWGLIAVEAGARGRGVGAALAAAVERGLRERGASHCVVATQGGNTASLRLFEKRGFRTVAVQLWFHRWFDRGRRRPGPAGA
jgi:ribosomal protein S18 acetylase RimI-like enzyme